MISPATRFRIVPSRSRVWIDARSNVHPIHTEAVGLEGWLELDVGNGVINVEQKPLGHVEFPIDNMKSGNPLEERELRRRVDARRYPAITGDLRGMKKTGDSSRYIVRGDVTFLGVVRTYDDEMSVAVGDGVITLTGQSTFDIRDFGMEPPRILIFKVQPEVTVRVEIVAEKES